LDAIAPRAALCAEALVALGNPKAVLIFAAFFRQFVDPGDYWRSFAAVASVFLLLEALAILAYATLGWLAGRAVGRRLLWLHKVSRLAMIVFGVLPLLARRAHASAY
jgi:threonine/homoserine/homoserine lactone efflux protein